MSQKNKKLNRNFIPQLIGDTIRKINRNFTSKFGRMEFIIQSKWPEIAGSYFADFSEPNSISKVPNYENELGEKIYKYHLNVSVAPGAALEFQHFKDTIIEKINSYLGYKAIIDLRINQNYIPNVNNSVSKMNMTKLTKDEKTKISDKVEDLSNKDLKESLIDLGKNIAKDSKDL